jgi:EAL domain-containing protein (putative c-di-GMP-specific phosphodiesterase class I)
VRVFGVKIALDEFGAGSSPAAYLKVLPADVIKIDGALISNIMQPANAAIVESIVRMAGNLGMQTIATGAHDGAMERALARAGVDYVHGNNPASGKARPQLAPPLPEQVTPSA